MHLNLRDQQLKIIVCVCVCVCLCVCMYVCIMVTTNQKYIVNTHTQKRNESKYNIKDSHQIKGKRAKEEEMNKKDLQPQTINKMAINTCLSTITLNVNGLNATIKRHRVSEMDTKIRPIYVLPI